MDTGKKEDSIDAYFSDCSSDSMSEFEHGNKTNFTIAELKGILQDRLLNQPKRMNILGRRNALK